MSFIDAVRRAESESEKRQKREDQRAIYERNKQLDKFFKARVNDFVLLTKNDAVLKAYDQMINGKNTDAFYSENNYINP